MKILCIGDVVSRIGREMLFRYVDELKYQKQLDLVIANGENATHGRGMARSAYNEIMRSGVDIVTMGNHTWGCREVIDIMRKERNVIRPANYSGDCPGEGSLIHTLRSGEKVGVINLIGRTYLEPSDSPFEKAEKEIEKLKKSTNIILVDFHAEATSEKLAMGYFLDGKVSVVFGTHTHVQTSDDVIMPEGTGYITDLGMTGPQISILGREKNSIIKRFLNGMPQKFEIAEGKGQFCGCIFEIDPKSGKCAGTERIFYREK
ncbi:MAG: TIGR00282 family metallophosphoesterase [Oscillospiraceae bacterium]|nr:TIGR00282 family metallophosphoesterase [Oscillospiraceae bacterium]